MERGSPMTYYDYRQNKLVKYTDAIDNGWRKFPPSLQIGLTDFCFNKCATCDHWFRKNKVHMDFDSLKDFLILGKMRGLETVCFSGGDPFRYPSIRHVIQACRNLGLEYGFITGGYVNQIYLNANDLVGAKFVRVSLDAVSPLGYVSVRGGVKVHKVINSIVDMVDAGVKVGLGVTISEFNGYEIDAILQFALLHNIKEVRLWPARNDENYALSKELRPSITYNWHRFEKEFEERGISNNLAECREAMFRYKEDIRPFDHCYASLLQHFVQPNGLIYPCCIMAGDTEDKEYSKPLCSIEMYDWPNAVAWSRRSLSELPDKCKTGCIPRLSSINAGYVECSQRKHFI
jgi:MoaA/NifB/PqqE/SkfB family radical SAM enzyme